MFRGGALDMAAEFETHRRQKLVAERALLARAKPREQRRGENVRRHSLFDRRIDGPAAFAQIRDRASEICKVDESSASAMAPRSRSQDEITLPRRQTSAMSARSKVKRSVSGSAASALPRKMSNPSA